MCFARLKILRKDMESQDLEKRYGIMGWFGASIMFHLDLQMHASCLWKVTNEQPQSYHSVLCPLHQINMHGSCTKCVFLTTFILSFGRGSVEFFFFLISKEMIFISLKMIQKKKPWLSSSYSRKYFLKSISLLQQAKLNYIL